MAKSSISPIADPNWEIATKTEAVKCIELFNKNNTNQVYARYRNSYCNKIAGQLAIVIDGVKATEDFDDVNDQNGIHGYDGGMSGVAPDGADISGASGTLKLIPIVDRFFDNPAQTYAIRNVQYTVTSYSRIRIEDVDKGIDPNTGKHIIEKEIQYDHYDSNGDPDGNAIYDPVPNKYTYSERQVVSSYFGYTDFIGVTIRSPSDDYVTVRMGREELRR